MTDDQFQAAIEAKRGMRPDLHATMFANHGRWACALLGWLADEIDSRAKARGASDDVKALARDCKAMRKALGGLDDLRKRIAAEIGDA